MDDSMLHGHYNPLLVVASLVIAVFASFTALDLSDRVGVAAGRMRLAWLASAAVAMGGGIWSMHFVAMLALGMEMPATYDVSETLLSLVVAIAVSGLGFAIVAAKPDRRAELIMAGAIMGIGVAAMHYIGMDAMRMNARILYHPAIVAASVGIAILAATAALWLAFNPRHGRSKFAAACVMGAAIAGMHYTGMAGAEFMARPSRFAAQAGFSPDRLAAGIATITFIVLSFGLVSSIMDRRFAAKMQDNAAQLARQMEVLSSLIENLPIGVSIFDADWRLRAFNRPYLEIPGYPPALVTLGCPIQDIIRVSEEKGEGGAGDVEARISERFRRVTGGKPLKFERLCHNGRLAEFRHVPLATGGFVSATIDVTEPRKMEQRLAEAQKMEAVGRLSGGIAHEFNNLLAAIIGNLEEILDASRKPLDRTNLARDAGELAEAALQPALQAAELVQRLLAFGRKQPLRPKRLDVAEMTRAMEPLLRRYVGPAIGVQMRMQADLWPVFTDPTQLESAIVNLVFNARDAMGGGGQLTLGCGNIVLDEASGAAQELAPGDYVALSISDTGVGIPPELLPRVFEPFFTTKDVGEGTGLGLSMVYGFARQSGGTAKISSQPGQGTEVTLYLPRAAPAG